MYQSPFYITEKISNNVFSYDERKKRTLESPQIFVPSVKNGNLSDLQLCEEICFQEIDENNTLQSCTGLQNFIQTKICNTPAVIVDNHSHVFYFWWEWYLQNYTSPQSFTLIHIDQHADMGIPDVFMNHISEDAMNRVSTLDDIFRYTNTHLNIANFIVPAQKMGLIDDVIQVRSEHKLEQIGNDIGRECNNIKPYILDIDLDFFESDIGMISFDQKKNIIQELAKKAKYISIATSPFFIDQGKALSLINQLFT